MIPGRTVILAVGLLVALGAVTGAGGLSSVAAERGVQVSVADDEDAYLGFEQTARRTNGTTNLTVTVTNQFPSGVELSTVDVSVADRTANLGSLDSGEAETITFEFVDCDSPITVEASGDGTAVHLDRIVTCD